MDQQIPQLLQQQLKLKLEASPTLVLGEVVKYFSNKKVEAMNMAIGKGLPIESNGYVDLSKEYVLLKKIVHRLKAKDELDFTKINILENKITSLRKHRQIILKNMGL